MKISYRFLVKLFLLVHILYHLFTPYGVLIKIGKEYIYNRNIKREIKNLEQKNHDQDNILNAIANNSEDIKEELFVKYCGRTNRKVYIIYIKKHQ